MKRNPQLVRLPDEILDLRAVVLSGSRIVKAVANNRLSILRSDAMLRGLALIRSALEAMAIERLANELIAARAQTSNNLLAPPSAFERGEIIDAEVIDEETNGSEQ